MSDLETFTTPINSFTFSAQNINDLGATEITLSTIVIDESYSVTDFKTEIESCCREVIKSCNDSPRKNNLLLRTVAFNHKMREIHGFKPLISCKETDYNNFIKPSGSTALFDVSLNAIEATISYGENLIKNDFSANGIVIVITDGEDNSSRYSPNNIVSLIKDLKNSEKLESLITILVGVNVNNADLSKKLKKFFVEGNFTQYIEVENASKKELSKLQDFISKSISAQSQALGTGGSSQPISW